MDQTTADKVIHLLNEILRDRKKLDQIQQDLDKTSKRTDQIEARQSPRRLTQTQAERLVKMLKQGPTGLFNLHYLANNNEARTFAHELGNALVKAGWVADKVNSVIDGNPPVGIRIDVKDKNVPRAILLQYVLKEIGFHADGKIIDAAPDDSVSLYVGLRP